MIWFRSCMSLEPPLSLWLPLISLPLFSMLLCSESLVVSGFGLRRSSAASSRSLSLFDREGFVRDELAADSDVRPDEFRGGYMDCV
jgi:hypothetical protein